MKAEELLSKKLQVYSAYIESKNKKSKGKGKGKAKKSKKR